MQARRRAFLTTTSRQHPYQDEHHDSDGPHATRAAELDVGPDQRYSYHWGATVSRTIEVNVTQWPLVVVRFPTTALTAVMIDEYLAKLDVILERQETYATVVDSSQMTDTITATQRAALTAWIADNADALATHSAGTALVVRAAAIKGVAVAMNWIHRPPNAQTVHGSFDEAMQWALTALQERGAIDADVAEAVARALTAHQPEASPKTNLIASPSNPDQLAAIIDLFTEPAYVVASSGRVLYANAGAKRVFPQTPLWLAKVVSTTDNPITPLCRVQRIESAEGSLYLVVPTDAVWPPAAPDPRALTILPPSLNAIANLLAMGLADKEISQRTGRNLSTVRTYVTRIFRRVGVHSRGEFIALWSTRPQQLSASAADVSIR